MYNGFVGEVKEARSFGSQFPTSVLVQEMRRMNVLLSVSKYTVPEVFCQAIALLLVLHDNFL